MLKFLKKVLGKRVADGKCSEAPIRLIKLPSIDALFFKHFTESKYFKSDSYDKVVKHFKHEIDLNKSGKKLTASEKKELGLNARLSITSELVSVLSSSGLKLPDPKNALNQVYYRASFEASRIEGFNKMLDIGISTATYNSSNGDKDCLWCKTNDGMKFTISEALNNEVNENCSCDWNRGFFSGGFNFDK
ncbi:hypothetical protein AB4147_02160 [Vibrio cyclitrophicus]